MKEFTPNQAIVDPETHEKVVKLLDRIKDEAEKSKWVWEDVPPEEDDYIESYNISFDFDLLEILEKRILDDKNSTPWETVILKRGNGETSYYRQFKTEESYKNYLSENKKYTKEIAPYIFGYCKTACGIYKNKSLEFQALKFKSFDNLITHLKKLTEDKNIILVRFGYAHFEFKTILDDKLGFKDTIELEEPESYFYIKFALVDK
jgi:hypothetical protein